MNNKQQDERLTRMQLEEHFREFQSEEEGLETVYLQELFWSDVTYGKTSATSGMILLRLQSLYEVQGRQASAERMEVRARAVLKSYGSRLGLG